MVHQAYPTADTATREIIGINFLENLPRPASEMKLHIKIKGRPWILQEAVAHATEVDAVVEDKNKKTH